MHSITLPDSLVTQLRIYEARLRRMETLAAVAGGLVGLLATFVLLFVFDRFGDTPRWARAVLTLGGTLLAAWFAHAWAQHWLWNRRGPAQLARLLQRHFKTLGDRLQGIIELTETDDLPPNISPALMRAAIRQVAGESGRFDFTRAVPVEPTRRWGLAAIMLALLAAAPFVFVPRAAANALQRWLAPWAQVERYTFASLETLPRELVVPHGESFEIACGLTADSAWKPGAATARLDRQEPQHAKMQEGRAVFRLAGLTRDGVLKITVGDASREVAIRPLHRPEMKELAAHVELPAYLGYPAATTPVPGSSAEFLEGSRVSFSGRTSRALREATMTSGAAEVRDDTFTTPPKLVAELAGEATFRWADRHGLTPTQPYTLRVAMTKDAEPRIELQGLEPETAILPNEVLKLTFAASDDFGIKEAWLGWSARALGEKKEPGKGEGTRTAGAQKKKEVVAAAEFSPVWSQIPEDSVVELAAYALDYLPGRQPVESWKHTVYVLSPAKHAERVRERMDQVLKQLDERIRDEERQIEETTAIAQEKKELPSEKTGEAIKRAAAGEKTNAAQLQKLTEEMRDVMKDALRNKDIPEGTVADWQQLTEQLEKQASPPMAEAARTLEQAAQQPEKREPQLAEAREQEQQALDAMRKAASKMNTANQNLYARNFYNRLRAAASSEHRISDGLKKLAKETVGLKPDEIAADKKQDFTAVASNQDSATKDVDGIVNDMGAFTQRVPNEKYETVLKDMREKKVVAELTDLSDFVRANLGLKSVGRARQWGNQLDDWASQLQSECKSQGGGQGEMDPDLMEFIIAMVRAAQAEDNVREQTQLLESRREANPRHTDDAGALAGQQEEVSGSVGSLLAQILWPEFKPTFGPKKKSKFAEFEPLLEKVQQLMGEVTKDLRKALTDEDTVGVEGAIIELLVPPDKKGGKSESKMQQMMKQMMAQATKSRSPGGNNSKSSSGLVGDPAEGASRDKAGARNVEKAGGASNAGEWPEEFRDQLQAYFLQLEAGAK